MTPSEKMDEQIRAVDVGPVALTGSRLGGGLGLILLVLLVLFVFGGFGSLGGYYRG